MKLRILDEIKKNECKIYDKSFIDKSFRLIT